jgi:hypothetical protein
MASPKSWLPWLPLARRVVKALASDIVNGFCSSRWNVYVWHTQKGVRARVIWKHPGRLGANIARDLLRADDVCTSRTTSVWLVLWGKMRRPKHRDFPRWETLQAERLDGDGPSGSQINVAATSVSAIDQDKCATNSEGGR